jgi:anti-sigma factor RsiW
MTEEEEFFAWLDGELDAEQAAKVEKRVAASPDLTTRAAEHRRLSAGLKHAFDPILESRVPPPGFASVETVDLGARTVGREARHPLFGIPQWAAMAATLAVGLFVGNLAGRGPVSPVAVDSGQLVAGGL